MLREDVSLVVNSAAWRISENTRGTLPTGPARARTLQDIATIRNACATLGEIAKLTPERMAFWNFDECRRDSKFVINAQDVLDILKRNHLLEG